MLLRSNKVFEELFARSVELKLRMELLRAEAKRIDMAECTFKPDTTKPELQVFIYTCLYIYHTRLDPYLRADSRGGEENQYGRMHIQARHDQAGAAGVRVRVYIHTHIIRD